MFSLRVAILLALSTTQFDSYAVCGYTVDIPFTVTVDEPPAESNNVLETTSPCPPETTNNPVIENPTVPALEIGDSPNAVASAQFALLHQNFNISGPGRKEKRKSCICKECNPENGFFIKHFRQYNYYYPHHKITVPMQYIDTFNSEEPIDDFPVIPSMRNINGGAYSSKRSSKSSNKPGVESYVPNNDNNYIYNQFDLGARQSAPVNSKGPVFDESSMDNEEPASSDESAEPIIEPNLDDETNSANHSDDNINEDIINYFSEPDVFGHNRRTVIKNGNSHFQSQQVSISSRSHSQSQPQILTGFEPLLTQSQSQPLSGFEPQQQDRVDMNRINIQTQTLPNSESQQEDRTSSSSIQSQPMPDIESQQQDRIDMNKINIKTQTLPGSGSGSGSESQQSEEISSSRQSQTWPGFGPQRQDRINVNRIDIKSQSLPGSQSQSHQYKLSSSRQSQILPGFGGTQQQDRINMNRFDIHSQTLPNYESQQQQNIISSQSFPNFGPSINLANNVNFDNQNSMTVGYNPYFQSQTFGMSPTTVQLQPPITTSSFQNALDWLEASTAKQHHSNHHSKSSSWQSCNPVRTWSNSARQSTLFDLPNMSPTYSVII